MIIHYPGKFADHEIQRIFELFARQFWKFLKKQGIF